jgi:hypothetical protein
MPKFAMLGLALYLIKRLFGYGWSTPALHLSSYAYRILRNTWQFTVEELYEQFLFCVNMGTFSISSLDRTLEVQYCVHRVRLSRVGAVWMPLKAVLLIHNLFWEGGAYLGLYKQKQRCLFRNFILRKSTADSGSGVIWIRFPPDLIR